MACVRLIFFLLLASSTALARTELSFDETEGLFSIQKNTVIMVNMDFLFWEENWKWAETTIRTTTLGKGAYRLTGEVPDLNIRINGSAKATQQNQIEYRFTLEADALRTSVIGGGIVFYFNPEAVRLGAPEAEPELLPNNTGWRLKTGADGGYLTVRFDPAVARVFFERGQKNEIRAFFYDGSIAPGRKTIRMTVTLPKNGRIVPTLQERLGPGPDKTWYRDILHWATSPVDLSFLNEPHIPAGKHGFLKVIGSDLVFEDGTQIAFWGTNLMADALFLTNSVEVRRHAKRLSRLGFNLVRFHHHDSSWVQPNIFGNRAPDTLKLNNPMLKKLDWWIKALRDEGIYIWLDLNVGRAFTAKDGIRDFAEIAKGQHSAGAPGYSYINDTVQERMMEFQEAYLGHVNSYTSLAYKNDPAIIVVLVTNENDLTHHFGNDLLPDKNVPRHNAIYMAEANKFASANKLSQSRTWRSWEYGPSKIFLNELEHRFNVKMIRNLRSLGTKVPIATTQSWGEMPISSLPALSDGGVIDVHSYGAPNEVESNPRYSANLYSWMAAAQVVGKPLTVSEWNLSPFPAFDRSYLPLQVAAMARLQAWDASMQYGYAQIPLNSVGRPSNWHAFNDPAALALMPAAALIYRQGHVRQAEKTYALKLDSRVFYYKKISPQTSAAIRTIAEQSRLVIELPETSELPWLRPEKAGENAIIVTDPDQDFLPAGQNFVRSDTGEIYRNWEDGVFTINTEKSQVAAGWLGGKSIVLQDISVDLKTTNAAVAVQSLDGRPIIESSNILISLSARSIPSPGRRLRFLSEPVIGTLTVSAPKDLSLYAVGRSGKDKPLHVEFKDGKYIIPLTQSLGTYWLRLHSTDIQNEASEAQ